MATRKKINDDGGGALFYVLFLLGLVFLVLMHFVLFGVLTLIYHRFLMKKYFREDGSVRRINDIAAIGKPSGAILSVTKFLLMLVMFVMFVMFPLMIIKMPDLLMPVLVPLLKKFSVITTFLVAKPEDIVIYFLLLSVISAIIVASPLIYLWYWLNTYMFKWLAVAHFGVIVDPVKDLIVFQFDQESYDFLDYLKLRFIKDLPKMDEIRLSEIGRITRGRITRKSGDDLYIHGSFGSRRITFTNKQKRDECIYAITSSGRTSAKVSC